MEPDSMDKTAFPTPDGLFEWTVMPFGLTNAVATFERFIIESVMSGVLGKFVHAYIDDILVFSRSWTDHMSHLRVVFERFRAAGVKLKPSKCRLAANEITFLGHKLTSQGLRKDESKVTAIIGYPQPTNVLELRRFLGLVGYYRKFIKGFAIIAKPLLSLLRKGSVFEWSIDCSQSFEALVNEMCDDVMLEYPDYEAAKTDPKRRLVIQTDASRDGIAGILGQYDGDGKARPICFASRTCNRAEAKYPITELEALAVNYAIHKFEPYILGLRVIVETDHSALVPMFKNPKECGSTRVNKWAMSVTSKFPDLDIVYKPGKSNANADALSRAFPTSTTDCVNAIVSDLAEGTDSVKQLPSVTRSEWIEAQAKGEFGSILEYLTSQKLPESQKDAQNVLENLCHFTLIEGCLYYVDPAASTIHLVVPSKYRKLVFHERHGGVFGTHASARKIYSGLRREFYWVNMRGDCEKWGRECPVCAYTREPRRNLPPLHPIETLLLFRSPSWTTQRRSSPCKQISSRIKHL